MGRSGGSGLGTVLLLLLILGAFAVFVYREREQGARAWQAQQKEQQARVAARRAALSSGRFDTAVELCREGWREGLGLHHEPIALAWTPHGLDGYFLEGSDRDSLRQVRCDAQGVSRGPRVRHPLQQNLPAEAPTDTEAASAEAWHLALAQWSARSFDTADLAVELLAHPLGGAVLQRRWRAGADGAHATVDPADAPPFPLLVALPRFHPAKSVALPALQAPSRHHWLAETDAALTVVERSLPPGARVSEITLSDDRIELEIHSPTPAFEGKPVAPYGEKKFDEYGVADSDWWYPREIPGFGCPVGEPLPEVRTALAAARSRLGAAPLAQAWYSCSSAYGDGRRGAWHLQTR